MRINPDKYYGIVASARIIGCSRQTIAAWCDREGDNRLPSERSVVNGRRLILGAHLLRIKRNQPLINSYYYAEG